MHYRRHAGWIAIVGGFSLWALFVLSNVATAADLQITCTGPTQYTDGTGIPAGTAITYTLYGGLQGATKAKLATAQACAFARTSVAAGTQEYYVTASVAGVESGPSVTLVKVIPPPTPKPPTTVIGEIVAYEVRQNSRGVMVATRIGIVPPGTACTSETRVANGVTYTRVAPGAVDIVNWPVQLNPLETWAKCS